MLRESKGRWPWRVHPIGAKDFAAECAHPAVNKGYTPARTYLENHDFCPVSSRFLVVSLFSRLKQN